MEAPGFLLLLYIMFTLPDANGLSELPLANWTMAGMFVSPNSRFPSPLQFIVETTIDHSLCIPSFTRSALSQSFHVSYTSFSLGLSIHLPDC